MLIFFQSRAKSKQIEKQVLNRRTQEDRVEEKEMSEKKKQRTRHMGDGGNEEYIESVSAVCLCACVCVCVCPLAV